MIHPSHGNGGGDDARDGRDERVAVQLCRSGGAHPPRHPLRKIRQVVNDALASLDAEFEALYTDFGRPSIPPERLIRASLLQILFSVRSERQLMEQMDYNLMFRWFVGPRHRRSGLGADGLHQEPRPAADHRDVAQGDGGDPGASRGRAALVGRALLGRRHAGQGLGFDEELPAEGRGPRLTMRGRAIRPDPDATPTDRPSETPAETDPMPRNTTATAMPRSISRARSARMPPMPRPPIPMRGSTRNPPAPGPCCASWGMR
jgi:hypothetical protein